MGTRSTPTTERDPTTFGLYFADIELEDGWDVASVLIEAAHASTKGKEKAKASSPRTSLR